MHSHCDDWGYTRVDGAISIHRLVLRLADRPTLLKLLLHEMCHLDSADDGADGHGPRWKATMERVGMQPDAHELRVVKGGQFERWLTTA